MQWKLKELRSKKGLSLKTLASYSGVSEATIRRIEKDSSANTSMLNLYKLVKALEVKNLNDLIDFTIDD